MVFLRRAQVSDSKAAFLLSRRETIGSGLAILASSVALGQPSRPRSPLSFTVDVPIDHDRPSAGTFALACEWGSQPERGQQTILLVADGQQFFLRPGGAARIQKQLFGSGFNVLGIVGRSRSEALSRIVIPKSGIDWMQAYRLLKWTQWTGDVRHVIEHLGLEKNGLGLYGRSGGANLIHQLLTIRPGTKARVAIQAAVNHPLDVEWGLDTDRFWSEFSGKQPQAAAQLSTWLRARPDRRRSAVLVLQRQNFYEPLDELPAARLKAVRAFLDADEAVIKDMNERYQIDSLEQMSSSLEGIGSTVRVYEFSAGHADPRAIPPPPLHPNTESLFYYAEPLSNAAYRPPVLATDWNRLRLQSAEVLQIAGRYDHTCDYRTQIGLNGLTRNSHLLILDDNHVFQRWGDTLRQPDLLQAWFAGGWSSGSFQREVAALGALRWRETAGES
jgi:hypothetical protein